MKTKELVKYWVAVLFLIVFSVTAFAGEIRTHKTDPTKFAFVGSVEEGDAQMLRDFLVDNQVVTEIAFWSGGGLVTEGIEMMEIIHLRGLKTVVMDQGGCYSICAFMWLGGSERRVEGTGQLGVHLPFMPHEVAAELGVEAYATEIARTMAWKMWKVETLGIEVDQYWWIMILATPSEEMYVFTAEELPYLEIR